jgi:hypothetical protein
LNFLKVKFLLWQMPLLRKSASWRIVCRGLESMGQNRIYVDNSAAAPVSQTALAAMPPYFTERFGNPPGIVEKPRMEKR